MCRTVYQFATQPVFNPCRGFVVVLYGSFPLVQQGFVHQTFGGCDHGSLINAVVDELVGMTTVNDEVVVLSAPKSNTATDLLLLVKL